MTAAKLRYPKRPDRCRGLCGNAVIRRPDAAAPAHVDERDSGSTGLMYILSTGCQWRAIHEGVAAALESMSIRSMEYRRHADRTSRSAICEVAVRRQVGTPARPRDPEARASSPRKRGRCIAPHGFVCRQEDQRQEAAYLAYAGLRMHAIVPWRESGSRRWGLADGDPALRLHITCLSSTRTAVQGAGVSGGGAEHNGAGQREIVKRSDGVRGSSILPKRWLVRVFSPGSIAVAIGGKMGSVSADRLSLLRLASIRICAKARSKHDVRRQTLRCG